MKRLKLIMTLTIAVTSTAMIVASYNLFAIYRHEKEQAMATVRECAENALLLEMVGRMQNSEEANQSYIRLNAVIEAAQQDKGLPAMADTMRTSLAGLLQFGLEFKDQRLTPDPIILDSIFLNELHRNGLRVNVAYIKKYGADPPEDTRLWRTSYHLSPGSPMEYELFVSPMYHNVLAHMWGIIIPFLILPAAFTFLSIYLTGIIRSLRTLEQMKDDFTHNMTHELKTPVAVAYSAADSMLRYYDQSDEARNRQFLKIILQRLSFLSGMIENILSMSMERFKTMKLDVVEVALKPVVEEVSGMIKLKARKPTTINIDIPDDLSVMADGLHLGNILSNLMDNAVKYSGDAVEITITADSGSLVIADNGIGIEKDSLPYIFDKFYRVGPGDRYEASGYGLGLFYVRQVTGLLGWTIDVASRPGRGTKFTIKFKSDAKR